LLTFQRPESIEGKRNSAEVVFYQEIISLKPFHQSQLKGFDHLETGNFIQSDKLLSAWVFLMSSTC